MATLYVTEHKRAGKDSTGRPIPIYGPFGQTTRQKVTIGASSAAITNGFKTDTAYVRIATDTDCQFEIGASPTADANSEFLAAGSVYDTEVVAGHKVAVIQQQ